MYSWCVFLYHDLCFCTATCCHHLWAACPVRRLRWRSRSQRKRPGSYELSPPGSRCRQTLSHVAQRWANTERVQLKDNSVHMKEMQLVKSQHQLFSCLIIQISGVLRAFQAKVQNSVGWKIFLFCADFQIGKISKEEQKMEGVMSGLFSTLT